MNLIGNLVGKLLKKGRITLLVPGKPSRTYGRGEGKHLTVRFTDRKVAFEILRNPRLGLGEAYMDGRLIVEDGTILDLLELIVGSNRWEDGGKGRAAMRRGKRKLLRLLKRNDTRRARRNVAHHYDLKDELYELFLDTDKQYSCAYFTDPGNGLEQAPILAEQTLDGVGTSGSQVVDQPLAQLTPAARSPMERPLSPETGRSQDDVTPTGVAGCRMRFPRDSRILGAGR